MAYVLSVISTLVIVLVSMILHELAHGITAYALGDDTAKREGRLTLNPFKHLDPVLSLALPLVLFLTGGPIFGGAKPVPVDSRNLKHGVWGMAIVAIAGPAMNFVLALVGFLLGHFTGWLGGGDWGIMLMSFVSVNLGFMVFNLIPVPPLDGSRVLYAIAPDPVREFMQKIEPFGIVIVMLLVILVPSFIATVMGGAMDVILQGFYWIVGAH